MKFEPLKGKGCVVGEAEAHFHKENLISAVGWLKEQIPNICVDLLSIDEERISKKIDEAFEDAMNKERKK